MRPNSNDQGFLAPYFEFVDCNFIKEPRPNVAKGHERLKQLSQQIAIAEAAMPVLGEGRVVRHLAVKPEPTELAVSEVPVHLLAQPPLGTNAVAVAASGRAVQDQSKAGRSSCKMAPSGSERLTNRQSGRSTSAHA
jgi:hypothetical protein